MKDPKLFAKTRISLISKEIFLILLGQVLAALGSLVTVRVLTILLSPASYGEVALGITAMTLVSQTLFGPIAQASIRYYSLAQKINETRAYLEAIRLTILRGLRIATPLIIVLLIVILIAFEEWLLLSIASCFYALLSGINQIINSIQNGARNRDIVGLHIGLSPWLRLLMAVLVSTMIGTASDSVMLGYVAASSLILVSELYFLSRRIFSFEGALQNGVDIVKKWRTRIVSYSLPFTSWGIITFVLQASDRWSLLLTQNTYEVGLYAALFQISGFPIIFLSGIVTQILEPIIYSRAGEGTEERDLTGSDQLIWWLVLGSLSAALLIGGIVALIHESLFSLLVDAAYQGVSRYMPYMVVSAGLFVTSQILNLFFMTRSLPNKLIAPKVGTALVGITLNIIGAYLFGLKGVVTAQVTFSTLYLLWMVVLIKRTLRIGSR